ncbi:hypothetical protein [Salinigranum sp. GCM10025319]|uniref:hypothetical protein n=1 Tax=Salinigranum sp. GCM10025319 TaxID=3252687 RepID=UPI00360FBEC3
MLAREHGGALGALNLSRRRLKSLQWLFLYVVLVGVGAFLSIDMLARGWESWGQVRHFFRGLISILGVDIQTFYYLPTGIAFGLVVTLLLDSFKRGQGLVLLAGIGVGSVVVLLGEGLLIQPLIAGFGAPAAIVGLTGVVLGLLLGGVRLRTAGDAVTPGVRAEFPQAPRWIFRLALLMVLLGFVEAHVEYTPVLQAIERCCSAIDSNGWVVRPPAVAGIDGNLLLVDVVGSILLLVGLHRFTRYESQNRTIVLGPQRSGKSAAFGGLHRALLDFGHDDVALNYDGNVDTLSRMISKGQFPTATGTTTISLLGMNYVRGGVFPEKTSIQTIDYAGEHLDDIVDRVAPKTAATDGGSSSSGNDRSLFSGSDEVDREVEEIREEVEAERDSGSQDQGGSRRGSGRGGYGGTDVEAADNWIEATDQVRELSRASEQGQAIAGSAIADAVANCVEHADRVVFVVPLDDFIAPIIERGTEPGYVEVVRNPGGKKSREEVADELGIDLDRQTLRGRSYADGEFYVKNDFDRPASNEYLGWYQRLARRYRDDRDKDFVVAVTMGDWAVADFEERNEGSLAAREYDEFCEYVYDELLEDELEWLYRGLGLERVYVLWYVITNDEPPETEADYTIDTTKRPTILRRADKLIERLER